MAFWKPTKTKKKAPKAPDSGQAVPARKKIHRSSPVVFEAKMLAIEAVNCGADRQDIAKILGINPSTLSNWLKLYRDEGIKGLCRKPSNKVLRKQCTELEKRIIAHRTENPEHGVRCNRQCKTPQNGRSKIPHPKTQKGVARPHLMVA